MKLSVHTDYQTGQVIIDLIDIDKDKCYIIGQKNGQLIKQEVKELGPYPKNLCHLLVIPHRTAHIFFKEMAEYLSGQNIKTENENHMLGRLQATEEHLKDMKNYFEKVLNRIC
jgi:hypothetical protein